MENRLVKHLFLSDLQIPDHNPTALQLVYKFIPDFKPDYLHLLGDLINLSHASNYNVLDGPTLGEEITEARKVIYQLVESVRQANPRVEINWYCGNHELRLEKYLYRQADKLTDITDADGEQMLTIPHLFHLKSVGIKWIPYYDTYKYHDIEFEHGDVVRCKAGYTGQAMLDKRGCIGFSGHTHKLAMVTRKWGDKTAYWVECGSLCNAQPSPQWIRTPDWCAGLAIGIYDPEKDVMYPQPLLIQKDSFLYNGKIYDLQEIPEETPEGNHPK